MDRKLNRLLWCGVCAGAVAAGMFLDACNHAPVGTAATPVRKGAPVLLAAAKPVAKPHTKWEEFHRTVQPFLEDHCYDCHGDDDAENGLRLDTFHDEASLEAGMPTLEKALKNLSIHKMPPNDEPQPTLAESKPIVTWLNDFLVGDPGSPINPGRVTLRRLNRAEYNNTIRDLLAIDIQPADSFPVDDAGYGFDNNGDVLSIAPVLMEKYLAAAKLSLEKAILCDPIVPPPLKRWEAATAEGTFPKSDPNASIGGGSPNAGGGQRRAMPIGRMFNASGEIYADYDVSTEGDYVLRVRAYGTQGSKTNQRPSVAFRIDGEQVQAPFTVKEEQRNTSVYALDQVHLTPGRHRITLALLNGANPEEAWLTSLKFPPPKPKTQAQLDAEEAAAVAAENAAEAATLVAAAKPAAGGTKPANGAGRGRRGRGGFAGRRPIDSGGSPTGKPTLGVVYFEAEGPLAITPDRMPESYRRVMVAMPSATVTKEQAAEKIIRNFAFHAFRRPVSDREVARLMGLWARADSDGRPFAQSIDLTLQAVLVSPPFLFRMESEPKPGEPRGIHHLDDYELANRLSYFLWSSMPDEELFGLAAKGKLRANLDAQVRRMLKDPKASALVDNFAGQWLQLRAMDNVTPDPARFPDFDEGLRTAMTRETQLFFNSIIQEDRSVLDFIDADYTFVNGPLAKHYGIPGVAGDDFQRVSLKGTPRGGVITQASVLTITSFPARTSPVHRGQWVLDNLLDSAPPPPPPDVPSLVEGGAAELTGTLRHRMEEHRSNPACAACHAQMDGIGFALENFDATGAWRTEDVNHDKIDASGTLPGGVSFNGPVELRHILRAHSDQFVNTLAGKMLTYALGRGLEVYDRRSTDAITAAMKQHGDTFSSMIEAIVRSEPFQERNGRPKTPAANVAAGDDAKPATKPGDRSSARNEPAGRTPLTEPKNDQPKRGDS